MTEVMSVFEVLLLVGRVLLGAVLLVAAVAKFRDRTGLRHQFVRLVSSPGRGAGGSPAFFPWSNWSVGSCC